MGELERSKYEIYQRKSDMISNEILYILENKILEENSLIVYETDNEEYVENVRKLEEKGILEILKIKKYGRPNIIYITGR